jgi:FkbM family methyltransferase
MGWRRGDPVLSSTSDPCRSAASEKIKSTSSTTMILKFPRGGAAFNPLQQRFASPSSISAGTGWWAWGCCWPRLRHWCFAIALFGLVVVSHWEIPESSGSAGAISSLSATTTIAATTPFVSIPPKFTKALAKMLTPLSTNEEESSSTSRLKMPPRPISCHDVRSRVQRAEWTDPNDGVLYARTLRTDPQFRMAVHTQRYDNVRWKSIYKKGEYYETDVHERFMKILAPPPKPNGQTMPSQLVLDVGMNIGYYTMLSATLGHSVIGFEINPANLIRVCESLDVNQMGDEGSPVAIFQRGVGNMSDQTLRLVVPSNPGQAKMAGWSEEESTTTDNTDASEAAVSPDVVTTITLDDFAEAYNWWEIRPVIGLLKIDVEGLEPEIIIGAEQLLKTGMVQHILTEFRNFQSANAQKAFQILMDNGYVLMYNHGAPYTKAATIALWDDFQRGRYHEPWRRTARTTLLLRPVVKDLWFSLE